MAATSAGGGLTLPRSICTNLDLPPPVTEKKPHRNYIRSLEDKIKADCERCMADATSKVYVHENGVAKKTYYALL